MSWPLRVRSPVNSDVEQDTGQGRKRGEESSSLLQLSRNGGPRGVKDRPYEQLEVKGKRVLAGRASAHLIPQTSLSID